MRTGVYSELLVDKTFPCDRKCTRNAIIKTSLGQDYGLPKEYDDKAFRHLVKKSGLKLQWELEMR